jgi:Ca2+-dependent lipid-binding protein
MHPPKEHECPYFEWILSSKSDETKATSNANLQKQSINPFARVTLYDGSPATLLSPPSFATKVVKGNGLNPVWNDREAAKFSCMNPSVGMLLFVVYDHCDITKTDVFIGASAIPVSCLREGYRCVSLYDSNNTRSGGMRFASLLIKVKIEF